MKRALVLAVALATVSAEAAKPNGSSRIVNGKAVEAGAALPTHPLLDITKLRCYDCRLKDTGAPCTVVVGYITPRFPSEQWVITIQIKMFETYEHSPRNMRYTGMAEAVIDRPRRDQSTRFVMLGPSWHTGQARDRKLQGVMPPYLLNVSVQRYKPPS